MEKKDSIKIISKLKELTGEPSYYLESILEINGSLFHPEFVLDITELARSCQSSGEMYLVTCGCGEPMCAGIGDGINIKHLSNAVVWHFKEPLSDKEYDDLGDEEWEAMKNPIEFRFDPEDYLSTIIAGIKEIKALVITADQPVELPIHGFMLEQLLALDPLVFNSRLDVAEKCLIAQNIEVDAYNNSLYVSGNYYRLEALFLPPSLIAAYEAWKTYDNFPRVETDLPAYQLYLQKGREFCHELRQFLGSESLVKLRYHHPKFYNALAWDVVEKNR